MVVVGHADVNVDADVAQYKDSYTNEITYIRPEIFCRQKKFGSLPIGKERTITKTLML